MKDEQRIQELCEDDSRNQKERITIKIEDGKEEEFIVCNPTTDEHKKAYFLNNKS